MRIKKRSKIIVAVVFFFISTATLFAEEPLLRITYNNSVNTTAYASHTVTQIDVLGLNAGNTTWTLTGTQTGNSFKGYFVKVNGSVVFYQHGTNNNFSTTITLIEGDVVELLIDIVTGFSESPAQTPSSGSLEINLG